VSRLSSINRISVMVPMLNEAAYVEQLARDLVGQDFVLEVR
jgi:cellulose synthase/poly-beta-1,6-N-acetylglucosamine synthase-like glycosyltransferase